MQLKKTKVRPRQDGRSSLPRAARTPFGQRSGQQSFKTALKSIAAAARLLPAEVAPPARVWRSLRAQLEKEGILGHRVAGRLEEHTRFPMFKN